MESIESILETYNEIKNNNDKESKFKCLDLLTMLQDDFLLRQFIDLNEKELIRLDPIIYLSKYVNYYLSAERVTEGLSLIEQYQNGPFISITVEDFLKELKEKLIESLRPKSNNAYSFDDIKHDLISNNPDRITKAIKALSTTNIRNGNYLKLISLVLKSEKLKYKFKILLEFILIEQKINASIEVINDDLKAFTINPSKMVLPFKSDEYLECVKYIGKFNETQQVINYAIEVLNITQVKKFPESYLEKENIYDMGEIFIFLAKKYLMEEVDYHELKKNLTYYKLDVKDIIEEIEKIVSE